MIEIAIKGEAKGEAMSKVMHLDEFIFNCCVSSMISDDTPADTSSESAMNVFSIDENKIRDANGIIFAEAITCYKCTFCGKMFAAMEVVLTHYQSNHRCSVIPLLKGVSKTYTPKVRIPRLPRTSSVPKKSEPYGPYGPIKPKPNVLSESTATNETPRLPNDTINNFKPMNNFYNKIQDNRKFKCLYPGCSKVFTYRLGLETHQKSHRKLKSYKCDWNDCQFKCSDLAGLHFHKNTHSGVNPFKCVWPGCQQSFPSSAAKDEHLQTEHIKDKLLECDFIGCGAKFVSAKDRERHNNATHIAKRTVCKINPKSKPIQSVTSSTPGVKKLGRPPKKRPIVESSTSSSELETSDEEEEESNQRVSNISQSKLSPQNDEQPLDLSKTSADLSKTNADLSSNMEAIDLTMKSSNKQKTENRIPGKRGRKRKKSVENKIIHKTIFRCDYPGCRKTFPDSDGLHEHEKETHKTETTDGRSRYERRCKGNLYYKL